MESEQSPEEVNTQQEPRRSQRATRGQPPLKFGFDEYAEVTEVTHMALHAAIEEPATMQEAWNSKYSTQWKAAADSEFQSLKENNTWELVELSTNRKAIGWKWVFRVKYGDHGQAEHFKGRFVAKGYSQKPDVDYGETFSPVVRFNSIRTLLAVAVKKGMLIHQMDVVTAFLNGNVDEEIYMEQPEGYAEFGKEEMVCKLKKSLYGHKQSLQCWNRTFRELMESLNFQLSHADPCIFMTRSEPSDADKLTVIAIYVDDVIIIATTEREMNQIKFNLSKHFKKELSLYFPLTMSRNCTPWAITSGMA